jgi:tetratricopeptide (TPR) repeat protein
LNLSLLLPQSIPCFSNKYLSHKPQTNFNIPQNILGNAQEVTRLRKLGQINEALVLVEALLVGDANNLYNRRAAAWVYLELIKTQCNTVTELNHFFQFIIHLKLEPNEEIFWEQFRWQIAKLFFRMDDSTTAPQWSIFCDLWATVPAQVSLGNSAFLKAILKHQAEIPSWAFCRSMYDLNIFQENDYVPAVLTNGKRMLSLVERVFIAIAKNWCVIIEKGNVLNDEHELNKFLGKLDALSEINPKMVYLIYYRAIIRLKLGDFQEAKRIFIPFAQKKQSEFWVWEVLSQLHPNDVEIQISCLAKALLCKTSTEFLVKVRQKMVELLLVKQDWNTANHEIAKIITTRKQNNWQIPIQVHNWQAMPEIANAVEYTNVEELYKKYGVKAESILWYTATFQGIIWKINPEKKTAQFFVDEKIHGGFNYNRLKVDVVVGTFLDLSLLEIKNLDQPFWQVQGATKSDGMVPESLQKKFQGTLKNFGKSGFVENVFVEESLLSENSGLVVGKAIRAYDSKKQSWGWKAISLDSL